LGIVRESALNFQSSAVSVGHLRQHDDERFEILKFFSGAGSGYE
jgi:hypothetical protein